VLGIIAVHVRSAGREGSERVTVPVKPLLGLTSMIEVAGVVPSAGTMLGRVVSTPKSGVGIEPNIVGMTHPILSLEGLVSGRLPN